VAQRYPQFELAGIAWAAIEPGSGVLLARRAVQAVLRKRSESEEIHRRRDCAPRGKQSLITCWVRGNHVSAGSFVFACGPWLPKMFPDLLGKRIQPTRQEVFYFGAPAGDSGFAADAFPVWIDFTEEVYGLPNLEGRGVKIAIDRHGPPFDPTRATAGQPMKVC
jgi:hypothetical protein